MKQKFLLLQKTVLFFEWCAMYFRYMQAWTFSPLTPLSFASSRLRARVFLLYLLLWPKIIFQAYICFESKSMLVNRLFEFAVLIGCQKIHKSDPYLTIYGQTLYPFRCFNFCNFVPKWVVMLWHSQTWRWSKRNKPKGCHYCYIEAAKIQLRL